MAEISLLKLTKKFGDNLVVDEVSLTVSDGEFLVLLGPSGCGKSTILRLIAGLEDATSGEIRIDGDIVNFKRPADRNTAMVFQNYALYPHRTVRKNIAFPLETARISKPEIKMAIDEAARILELDALLDRYPAQLSGGQRQRVALARAIVRKPGVFLMDEPLSNLDAQLRQQTRLGLMALHERLGITTAYVTHDQVEAMTMGHRIAVMHDGVMQQLGRPADIYMIPQNTFVARFLGAPPMNLLSGEVDRTDDSWIFRSSAGELHLYPEKMNMSDHQLGTMLGAEVELGIRPEHIELHDAVEGSGLRGLVHFLEPTGADLYATVDCVDQMMIARCPVGQPLSSGDAVELVFPPECVHVFGPDGNNLRAAV